MNHFLDSPDCTPITKTSLNYSLLEMLHTPSKDENSGTSIVKKKDSESAYSSTTIEDNCEVSFENGNHQKYDN